MKVLAPFDAATTLCSGNTYFTLNHVLPSMHQLHKYLVLEPANESTVCKKFKQAMKDNLELRYNDTHSNELLLSATALDPIYFRKSMYNSEYSDFKKKTYTVTEVLQQTVVSVLKKGKGSQFSQAQVS